MDGHFFAALSNESVPATASPMILLFSKLSRLSAAWMIPSTSLSVTVHWSSEFVYNDEFEVCRKFGGGDALLLVAGLEGVGASP